MAVPSVKTLSRVSTFDPAEDWAKKLRNLCERFAYQQPIKSDSRARYILAEANEITGCHGVDYIPAGNNKHSPAIWYVNAGDGYLPTLCIVRGRIKVAAWADIVERGNYA